MHHEYITSERIESKKKGGKQGEKGEILQECSERGGEPTDKASKTAKAIGAERLNKNTRRKRPELGADAASINFEGMTPHI